MRGDEHTPRDPRSTLRRRDVLALALSAATSPAASATRVPVGAVLRVPLASPWSVLDPARAVDLADVWPAGLCHEGLARRERDGRVAYPLLLEPPVVDRGDPRVVSLRLRPDVMFSHGAALDAAAVVASWRAVRANPLGRLVLSLCAPMDPFRAAAPDTVSLRLAAPGSVDDVLCAPVMAVTAAAAQGLRGGLGAFALRDARARVLQRNARCPLGAAFLERVELTAPTSRNEELRAFTTSALDASWWGSSLYEVSRPAERVTGPPGAVVGLIPVAGGLLAGATLARVLESMLSPLAGRDGPLQPLDGAPRAPVDLAAQRSALVRAVESRASATALRIACEPRDVALSNLAERVVALLDTHHLRATVVAPGEPADASLRAVAPVAPDPALALASFMAASAALAGDEAGASAIARTAPAARAAMVTGVWSRSAVAVLGRQSTSIFVRAGVRGARFDAVGRLALEDAWATR